MIADNRIFIVVLDSFGIGALPDAAFFGDEGTDTFGSVFATGKLRAPFMRSMGLFNIDGISAGAGVKNPSASFARLGERSLGKDTTTGHWEIAGLISPEPFPTFPDGFPRELTAEFERVSGRGILCNRPYSGTELIKDFGEEHLKTGKLIVYTSADSVCQIAAHEDIIPLGELYRVCGEIREILKKPYNVGRVIARPFSGKNSADFKRTADRRDFSLTPPKDTLLDILARASYETIGVGKISDIFAGKGISDSLPAHGNSECMQAAVSLLERDFRGLAFVNLVDFDMLYGHRNDADGYALALGEFDAWLGNFVKNMRGEDVLIITADHGCDPGFLQSTDHSREYAPMLIYGKSVKNGINLGTRASFADISATVLDCFGIKNTIDGESFLQDVLRR